MNRKEELEDLLHELNDDSDVEMQSNNDDYKVTPHKQSPRFSAYASITVELI